MAAFGRTTPESCVAELGVDEPDALKELIPVVALAEWPLIGPKINKAIRNSVVNGVPVIDIFFMLLSLTIYSVPWTNGYSFAVNEQTKNRLPAMSDLRPVSRGFIREASFWERCLSGPF